MVIGSSILSLIVLILSILAIIGVVQSDKKVGEKVVWIIVILLLPCIGLLLWYFIGSKK